MLAVSFLVFFLGFTPQAVFAREDRFITCPAFDSEDASWVMTHMQEEYNGWLYMRSFTYEPDPFARRMLVSAESCYRIRSVGFGTREKILWVMHRRDNGTLVRLRTADNHWKEGAFLEEIAEYGNSGNFFRFVLYNEGREIVTELRIPIPKDALEKDFFILMDK